jgi:predicted nucleotidyltransferase
MNLTPKEAELGIEKVAALLRQLKGSPRFVFIGGGSVPLHVTVRRKEAEYRATKDIDVVIPAATYADYNAVGEQLRKLGFADDLQLPIRWHLDDLMVDILPAKDIGHGMGNRWFHLVLEHAVKRELAGGTIVELAVAPVLLATKLEAFRDRGKADPLASHDLEDIITLLDGRPELVEETKKMPDDLQRYLAERSTMLLGLQELGYVLEGNLTTATGDEERVAQVLARLRELSALQSPG